MRVPLLLLLGAALVMRRSAAWPAPLPGPLVVTSRYGARGAVTLPDGTVKAAGWHAGIDLRAAVGTPLRSVMAGVVSSVEDGRAGLIVRVTSPAGRVSYVHLDRADVRVGQPVAAGQLLGTTGQSGGVAPHLHLEWRPTGATAAADPAPLLGVA